MLFYILPYIIITCNALQMIISIILNCLHFFASPNVSVSKKKVSSTCFMLVFKKQFFLFYKILEIKC